MEGSCAGLRRRGHDAPVCPDVATRCTCKANPSPPRWSPSPSSPAMKDAYTRAEKTMVKPRHSAPERLLERDVPPTTLTILEWTGHKGQRCSLGLTITLSSSASQVRTKQQLVLRLRDSPHDSVLTPSSPHSNQYPRPMVAQSRAPRHRGSRASDRGVWPEASPTANPEDGCRGGTEGRDQFLDALTFLTV